MSFKIIDHFRKSFKGKSKKKKTNQNGRQLFSFSFLFTVKNWELTVIHHKEKR
jgi:hypothetical protein